QLMLQNNKSSTEIINSILSYNVDIGLCHNAIRNNNIKKKLLIKGLKVLPEDGNVTIYKFQKKGYTYIKM
ncbi:MAG: hypothetical protein ACC653_10815, partial [Gammaproteobacteria bacterium]